MENCQLLQGQDNREITNGLDCGVPGTESLAVAGGHLWVKNGLRMTMITLDVLPQPGLYC